MAAREPRPSRLHHAIQSLPADRVAPPRFPVERLVAEANALATVAKKHRDALRRAGVTDGMIQELRARSHALSEAQAKLDSTREAAPTRHESRLRKTGRALRRDMIADGRFALRDDPDAQSALTNIQRGDRHRDIVQTLRDLEAFALAHERALARVGARPREKAKRARTIASELEALLAARKAHTDHRARAVDVRNRIATLLTMLASEIRRAGVYVFRDDPRNRSKYRCAYYAERRANRKPAPAPPGVDAGGSP